MTEKEARALKVGDYFIEGCDSPGNLKFNKVIRVREKNFSYVTYDVYLSNSDNTSIKCDGCSRMTPFNLVGNGKVCHQDELASLERTILSYFDKIGKMRMELEDVKQPIANNLSDAVLCHDEDGKKFYIAKSKCNLYNQYIIYNYCIKWINDGRGRILAYYNMGQIETLNNMRCYSIPMESFDKCYHIMQHMQSLIKNMIKVIKEN